MNTRFFLPASAFSRESASSSVMKEKRFFTFSSPAIGGVKGREPVATSSLSYFIFSPPESKTSFACASIFSARVPGRNEKLFFS